jgi:hypothetical protein
VVGQCPNLARAAAHNFLSGVRADPTGHYRRQLLEAAQENKKIQKRGENCQKKGG